MAEKNEFKYYGDGAKLLGIYIVNILLSILTLGVYYFWGKASLMRYIYMEAEFAGSRFTFHGNGKEFFFGFLKAIVILFVFLGIPYALIFLGESMKSTLFSIIGVILLYAALFVLIPVAIHGKMRYRLSRTSWRGIHMGFRGKQKDMILFFLKNMGLTIITFGIYSFWFTVNMRKKIIDNIRLGNVGLRYDGEGLTYFLIHLKGIFFSFLTLGIYSIWYIKELFYFYVNNILVLQNGQAYKIQAEVKTIKIFTLLLVNFLLTVFTLGFAAPWVIIRNLRFVAENSRLTGDFKPDEIIQTEEEYKKAMGEDMSALLDINVG